MEDNSEEMIDEDDNKHSDGMALTDNEEADSETDVTDAGMTSIVTIDRILTTCLMITFSGNVCGLESNQLSSVVPNLITSSGDCSNDEADSQQIIGDESVGHSQNVKIVKVSSTTNNLSTSYQYNNPENEKNKSVTQE